MGAGQPSGIAMSDEDSDGIWEVTLILPINTHYTYKFRNGYYPDDWSPGWESVPNNCGEGQYLDRFVEVGDEDLILPAVCFGSCDICP